jgi:Na+/melibiose symporter-like transporter
MELTGLLPSYGQTGQERAVADNPAWEIAMTLGTILLIILILLLVGAIPNWGYSRGWGYGPSGIIGVILLIVIILLLMGRL